MEEIYPKLPVKEGALRLIDQKVLSRGFTDEWESQRAVEKMLEIQQEHIFPVWQYGMGFLLVILVWQLLKHRQTLYVYFFPPEKRELKRTQKLIESWRVGTPKTAGEFSDRYSAMVALIKKKLQLPISETYTELSRQKGLEGLSKRAEKVIFATQIPDIKEYESDLEKVASLFQL